MAETEDYRQKALECLLAADGIADPEKRLTMLEMAQAWMRMAQHAERLHGRLLLGAALPDPPQEPKDQPAG